MTHLTLALPEQRAIKPELECRHHATVECRQINSIRRQDALGGEGIVLTLQKSELMERVLNGIECHGVIPFAAARQVVLRVFHQDATWRA